MCVADCNECWRVRATCGDDALPPRAVRTEALPAQCHPQAPNQRFYHVLIHSTLLPSLLSTASGDNNGPRNALVLLQPSAPQQGGCVNTNGKPGRPPATPQPHRHRPSFTPHASDTSAAPPEDTDIVTTIYRTYIDLYALEDLGSTLQVGMQTLPLETSSDAVRKYCAAFPALKKGTQSPLQYFLPPPAWCRKPIHESSKRVIMQQVDPTLTRDWNTRNKRPSTGKERRNSYHGQRKNNAAKKRCHSYSKSFESKENLPEWMTHEGVWDLETQDPIKEFIKALALDEGYGTCENTVTDDIRVIARFDMRIEDTVPDWEVDMDLDSEWVVEEATGTPSPTERESYAKFEAKFDSSIEALWSKEQANTPDDECQELPIDFHDLLSSPTDRPSYHPSNDKCSLISLTESIWSNDAFNTFLGSSGVEPVTPNESVDVLHDRFKPLNLTDEADAPEGEPFSLYSYEDIYDSVPSVASVMRSLTALNHSKSRSSFTEVLPRRPAAALDLNRCGHSTGCPPELPARPPEVEEDLLTSARTHFRPIGKESSDGVADVPPLVRYADGATFDISGNLDAVSYRRSESGSIYVESESERFLEYFANGHRSTEEDEELGFSLKFRVKQTEKGIQTDEKREARAEKEWTEGSRWGACDECTRLAGAKKMRQGSTVSGLESIWSEGGVGQDGWCGACAARDPLPPAASLPLADEWSRDWEELLSDISYAHARYAAEAEEAAGGGEWWRADRKRRHSAMVWCATGARGGRCPHPHDAPFLHCCAADRPLTR